MPKAKGKPDVVEGVVVDALAVEQAEVAGELATFAMFGQTWNVVKKPPTMMLSKLGTVRVGSPQAFEVVYQVAKHVLGPDQIGAFESAWFDAAPDDGDDSALIAELLQEIMGAAYGRPTQSSSP